MNKILNNIVLLIIITIIGGYYFKAKILPFFRNTRKIAKGLFNKIHLNKNANLTPAQYRKIALGAVYSEQQIAYINSLETGLGKSTLQELLANWWGITNPQEALEALTNLKDRGHRFFLPVVYEAFTANENQQTAIILNKFSNEDDLDRAFSQLQNLKDTLQELKTNNVLLQDSDILKYGSAGWDCGRLVFLSRICFDAGYISEEMAWTFIDAADVLAKSTFTNWNDYAKSYLLGRAMWGGAQSYNLGIISIAKYLQEEPNSPWKQLAW
ncbi:DUF1266 domain-containing protein [Flavobacterium foetidum]|uniref:DUF1266 domain-containing protein n=1 Tax=Flavobacterium foetidum TaxID=2026681 RepID=UPI001074D5C4|nr:DUF1266 domain-containing protein [Flavobacterium foetidum]KAF2509102.1 DUF1266 domain-containing protein [Flavobacterium foetidum]